MNPDFLLLHFLTKSANYKGNDKVFHSWYWKNNRNKSSYDPYMGETLWDCFPRTDPNKYSVLLRWRVEKNYEYYN